MTLPIIQTLWIGGSLSRIEQLCIKSFLKNKHEFHLYTYGEVKGVPKGAIIKDGNEILPESSIYTYNKGSYAGFADWFRWKLLYEKGGFWVDTDVICLKPFDFKEDIIYGLEEIDSVCPAVLGFPKKHEICDFLSRSCEFPNEILPYDSKRTIKKKKKRKFWGKGREHTEWGESGGPIGFTKALNHFKMLDLAKPFIFFYPIHFSNWSTVYDTTFKNNDQLYNDTYAIHLWNEMTRREVDFDKNSNFPGESLFEKLFERYS